MLFRKITANIPAKSPITMGIKKDLYPISFIAVSSKIFLKGYFNISPQLQTVTIQNYTKIIHVFFVLYKNFKCMKVLNTLMYNRLKTLKRYQLEY